MILVPAVTPVPDKYCPTTMSPVPPVTAPMVRVVPDMVDPVATKVSLNVKYCSVGLLYTMSSMPVGNRFEYKVSVALPSNQTIGGLNVSLKKGTVPFHASVMLVFCAYCVKSPPGGVMSCQVPSYVAHHFPSVVATINQNSVSALKPPLMYVGVPSRASKNSSSPATERMPLTSVSTLTP